MDRGDAVDSRRVATGCPEPDVDRRRLRVSRRTLRRYRRDAPAGLDRPAVERPMDRVARRGPRGSCGLAHTRVTWLANRWDVERRVRGGAAGGPFVVRGTDRPDKRPGPCA